MATTIQSTEQKNRWLDNLAHYTANRIPDAAIKSRHRHTHSHRHIQTHTHTLKKISTSS